MSKERPSGVKERILETAKELFISKGYAGTSIRDIASASDSNVAHIKYYYGSKAKLFEIIFYEAFVSLINRVSSILRSDMPLEDLIKQWIEAYYELLPQYPQIPLFILSEINHSPDDLVQKIAQNNPKEIFGVLSKKMEEEVEKGTIRPIPVINFGLIILSLCMFPFMLSSFVTRTIDTTNNEYQSLLKGHKEHVIDFVLKSLRI